MIWSLHSRQIDPINLSATPLCQGDLGAISLSRMPIVPGRRVIGGAIGLILIADQAAWRFIPGNCLRDLMCDPLRGRPGYACRRTPIRSAARMMCNCMR